MAYEDVIGIFDANGNQKFTQARSMRLQTSRIARMPQHPLETGTTVIDNRVIMPTEAQLLIVMQAADYRNGYSQIQAAFNTGELLSVQCKANTFANMCISEIPHEETPDMLDAVQMVVKLIEVQFFRTQAQAIRRPANSRSATTTRRGEQTPKPRESVAHRLFSKE